MITLERRENGAQASIYGMGFYKKLNVKIAQSQRIK